VKNDGFGVVLSAELPGLVEKRFDDALEIFLERVGMRKRDFTGYMFHPGGAKVLDAVEKVLKMPPGGLKSSRDTLRTYGNMSSPTALFVLKQTIENGSRGRHLLGAFGPGFSAYFAVIDL
jgi:alkylresorcinol/alkylpyrone synthase